MVDALGLVKIVWVSVRLVSSLTFLQLRVAPLVRLSACIARLSAMLSWLLSGVPSFKMAKGCYFVYVAGG